MPDLVLYDGVCGLCNRLTQFILRRDRHDQFRFATLQGSLAGKVLHRHGCDSTDLDTVYVIANFGGADEHLFFKARAVLLILKSLGGIWRVARLVDPLPSTWLDSIYDFIAARRYRWFGRSESCLLPRPGYRHKFLDELE